MALVFGQPSAPNSITTYLDTVFSTSLANYRKTLIDNIGATNAFLYKILKSDAYEPADGGLYIVEELLYALAHGDSYDGYDELSTLPTEGVTQAIFEWRQQANPIAYSMKQVIQNQHRIINLVETKIKQSELGIQEDWAQAFNWGAVPQGGLLTEPRSSTVNGSLNINPLPMLISYNTAPNSGTALTVGGINEFQNPWWRNHFATSQATTYAQFIYEVTNMYNTCALGTGGPPDLIITDQLSWQLFIQAYYSIYKRAPGEGSSDEFPFEWVKFFNAAVVMDDKIPDVYSNAIGVQTGGVVDATTLNYGSMFFVNTKFFKVRYHPERNWEMLKDENGKAFAKPINGDSRVGHVSWMGNVTINNRRKHGVLAKIPRSFAS